MRTKALAVAAGLLLAVTALDAQNPPAARGKSATARRPSVNPYGPQPGVTGVRNPTDLKTVLYYAADALGMLRGAREVDMVLTMELFAAGAPISTTYVATNAEIAPTLRRNLAAGQTATVTLPITKPGTMYAKRWNQLDVRVSKIFQIGRTRVLGNFDVFNVFNSAGVLAVNDRYGPLWQKPAGLVAPRLMRLGGQIDF